DGNILIKKMADLQREQFVQVFFQPAVEPANPYMCDWMLVNGEYIPVVKFIVIRPMLGTELRIIDSGYEPTEEGGAPMEGFHVWMQFNEPLNTGKSWMTLYNVNEGEWFNGNYPYCGELTFTQTGIYPNDTMVFTPCGLVPGHYIVFYNAVDADTGTEVRSGTWEFDLNFTLDTWDFSGTVTATGEITETPSDMRVVLEWTDPCGNSEERETYTDSNGYYEFTGIQFYNFHDVTIRLDYDGRYDLNTIIITPDDGYITESVDPFGGSVPDLDFEIFVD
ncbi:MAG: hypothetical protein ACPLPW_08250, partial [bacterium]